MRCSCPECGTYMAHSESMSLGCVCPECGARCRMCLGTDSVIQKDELRARAKEYMQRYESSKAEDQRR